jgi:2-C-methyl-D-erythritol 4-phosphate cytidylyltransferase
VVSPQDREDFSQFANVMILGIDVVPGGAERTDSVQNAGM